MWLESQCCEGEVYYERPRKIRYLPLILLEFFSHTLLVVALTKEKKAKSMKFRVVSGTIMKIIIAP